MEFKPNAKMGCEHYSRGSIVYQHTDNLWYCKPCYDELVRDG